MKKVKIGGNDCMNLCEASYIIERVYDYYSDEDSDVSRRLKTILKKIDYLIEHCSK